MDSILAIAAARSVPSAIAFVSVRDRELSAAAAGIGDGVAGTFCVVAGAGAGAAGATGVCVIAGAGVEGVALLDWVAGAGLAWRWLVLLRERGHAKSYLLCHANDEALLLDAVRSYSIPILENFTWQGLLATKALLTAKFHSTYLNRSASVSTAPSPSPAQSWP